MCVCGRMLKKHQDNLKSEGPFSLTRSRDGFKPGKEERPSKIKHPNKIREQKENNKRKSD